MEAAHRCWRAATMAELMVIGAVISRPAVATGRQPLSDPYRSGGGGDTRFPAFDEGDWSCITASPISLTRRTPPYCFETWQRR